MDRDPELDITLSNGRRMMHFQVTALDRDLGIWTVAEPLVRRRVILGTADALIVRQRLDARIGARLHAGWVPVDPGPTGTEAVAWPSDLAQDLSYLLDTVMQRASAFRAVDPTGQLWAACVIFRREAQRCGVPPLPTRLARAQRERRLGELAEHAGDRREAIRHYRAALALHPRVGVRRRLQQLVAHTSRRPSRPGGRSR
jgi:hypothetical protein